jgi:serine/threonine-protein kinase
MLALAGWGLVQADRAHRSSAPAATTDERDAITGRLSDPALLEAFQLARHHLARRTGFRLEARKSLEAVVDAAPDFAEAHALLGEAFLRQALYDRVSGNEAWARAEASVNRALALDETLATAHAVRSRIMLLRDWDFTGAGRESRRAIELDPIAPDARSAHALYLRAAGRVAEAIVERERAHRSDPMNPQWIVFLGDEYQFNRRFADAAAMYLKALQLERDYRPAVASLADVYPRMGRYSDAAVWQYRWLLLRGEKDLAAAFDDVRHREGPPAAMAWIDRRSVDEFRRAPDEHTWGLAYLSARLGDREAALQFLHRAYELRDPGMLQARVDPDLDSLRGDTRFEALLRRVGPR